MPSPLVAPPADAAGADVVIIGAGLVGLSCAAALSARGAAVTVIGEHREGEASPAAAGMLAPGVERAQGGAHTFALAARDRYPSFLHEIEESTGARIPLNRKGILELAMSEGDAEAMARARPPGAEWLDPAALRALDPSLGHAAGAVFHPSDGCVDNEALLAALRTALGHHRRMVRLARDRVTEIALEGGSPPTVTTVSGERYRARHIVLAAGAWVNEIRGLPGRLPVEPVRGQMIAFDAPPPPPPLVTYGPHGYLVPRSEARTIVGSTMERVGFHPGTTEEGVSALRSAATAISPALRDAPVAARWSGLRPVTPDLLPILGPDPAHPELLYACGHSRNGILLAPFTGDCIAALADGSPLPAGIEPFSPRRFLDR